MANKTLAPALRRDLSQRLVVIDGEGWLVRTAQTESGRRASRVKARRLVT